MSFSARYLPAILLTILSFPTSLWAQTAPKQTVKAPRSSISGRVTLKEKGVEGVVVMLRKSEYTNPYESMQRATTDQDGFYRIANVPRGSYEVLPSAPAFVPAEMREQRSKTVLVGDDENIENINFTLKRGGVITGKVTDADGRPVIQQQVNIFRVDTFERRGPQPQIFASGGGQTDDRGIYRVFGLAPGRYNVGAGRSDDLFNPQTGVTRSTYKQVFHPDVNDQPRATVIEVGEGTETTNVDITLGRTMQTFAAVGRVVDSEKGLPVPGIRLGFQRNVGNRPEFVNKVVLSNSQGDFVVEGLIPGKYSVFLFPNQSGGMRVETLTFDIIDQDLSALTVKVVQGASLSGIVVIQGDARTALRKFSEIQVRAFVVGETGVSGLGSSASSPVGPDGSFLLTGLPGGIANFAVGNLTGPFPAKGFVIARVEHEGVSRSNSIDIKDGEQLTGVRVVISYGTATVRGVVTVENGPLPEGARFFVRITKPGEYLDNLRPPECDARGHFLIEGLAAGTYWVYGTIGGNNMVHTGVKREITIQDGVTTDITLAVDMSNPQKP